MRVTSTKISEQALKIKRYPRKSKGVVSTLDFLGTSQICMVGWTFF